MGENESKTPNFGGKLKGRKLKTSRMKVTQFL